MILVVFMAAGVLLAGSGLALARTLPAQNVALILGLLVAGEFALEAIWNGKAALTDGLTFWPAMVVLARMGARRMLRRRRQDWNYGVWLILLSGAAVALVQFALSAMNANSNATLTHSPLKLSAIRFAATAVCLFVLAPWFISKLPQQPKNHAQ
jgi:ABC-type iron transport system FetAB permease component